MRPYEASLKDHARRLRREMTEAERKLWQRLRRKQILGVAFYRQKPLGDFVVDFVAPRVSLVVEVDGGHHWQPEHRAEDRQREAGLGALGFTVARYSNREVLVDLDAVVEDIWRRVAAVQEVERT